jgi:hypothetical protein
MTRLVAIAAALVLLVSLGGCLFHAPAQVQGLLVTMSDGSPHPWSGEFDNGVACSKSGTAEASGILGVAFGDSSIHTAMANGGITKIHHVDMKTLSVLGVYAKSTTVVWGE